MSSKKSCSVGRVCSVSLVALFASLTACAGGSKQSIAPPNSAEPALAESGLAGEILIDGSSTVFPISDAMAEAFQAANPNVTATVSVSGSGEGFKKLCAGEIDISNASRPIKQSEMDLCAKAGIEFVEVPIAFDGVSIVVNTDNNWTACLTKEELGKIWEPAAETAITNWSQVKEGFPDQPLELYGPAVGSGTYDYLIEAILTGDTEVTRGDFIASDDDDVIIQGVQSDAGGLGVFGFAYYEENKATLKAVAIENAAGECVEPSGETIEAGSYNPLSRPLFFYVRKSSLDNPAVLAFVQYQTNSANSDLISEVGYVTLPGEILGKVQERVDEAVTGSIFEGGSSVNVKLSDKL
ncbi:MAG: PstS family phosphate ABC transporter substrate-binding protein [Cyanothece sp. SIO1E1]|nr:PstS family phosphate ABC transporter substrate-binding protein [Cyanothece sp. SIO1E1]